MDYGEGEEAQAHGYADWVVEEVVVDRWRLGGIAERKEEVVVVVVVRLDASHGLKTRLDEADGAWRCWMEVEVADACGHRDSRTEEEAGVVVLVDGGAGVAAAAAVDVRAWRQNFPPPCAFCWQNHLLSL